MIAATNADRNMPRPFAAVLAALTLALADAAETKEIASTDDVRYSDAATAVMKTPIGPKPSESFYLADALESWGLADDAKALRVYLMHQFVKEARGEAHDPKVRAGRAIDFGRQMDPLAPFGYKDWFGEKWRAMARSALQPSFPDLAVAMPPDLARRARDARELAPGAWSGFDVPKERSVLYVLVEVGNQAPVALPLGAFTLRFEPEPGVGASRFTFDCPVSPDAAVTLIPPGEKRQFACASARDNPGRAQDLARSLVHVQAYPERATVTPKDFDGPQSVRDRDVDGHIRAIATISAAKLSSLLGRYEECAKANTCGEVRAARDLRKEPVAWTFIAFAIVVVYWALATFRSNRTAALLTWLACNAFAAWLVSQGPPPGGSGGWGGLALLIVYGGILIVPTILVAILYAAVAWLQDRGWWIHPH
jgi:hypothetical protein